MYGLFLGHANIVDKTEVKNFYTLRERIGLLKQKPKFNKLREFTFRFVILEVSYEWPLNEQGLALLGYLKNVRPQLKPNMF